MRTHFDELKMIIQQYKPKLVILTETHLTTQHDLDEYEIENYKKIECFSRSAHTGGVLMYVDDRVDFDTVSNFVAGDNWFLAIDVKGPILNGIYGGIYHSPSSSDINFIDNFEAWLRSVFVDERTNVFVGDFNIRWNEPGYSRDLRNVTEALGMRQLVSEPTRVGPSSRTMIDLVFTNMEGGNACILEELKISDHETICINPGSSRVFLPERDKTWISWRRYSKEKLQNNLRTNRNRTELGMSVNEAGEKFDAEMLAAVGSLVDVRSVERSNSNDWYGEQLKALKQSRDDAYRNFKSTNETNDWEIYKSHRNSYVNKIRASKNSSVESEIRSCGGDSKKLWRCLKSLIQPGGQSTVEVVFGKPRGDAETAILLNEFFVSSVEEINAAIPPTTFVPGIDRIDRDDLFTEFQPITLSKLKETVRSLKDCAGVGNVTKRVMVDALDVVAVDLLDIVNKSLILGEFPNAWKRTLVVPIPKIPKSKKPEDHRPINMLPLYEKVMETIVKEQLMTFIDSTAVLLKEQSGFRRNHSCESALNLLLLKWKQSIEDGNIVLSVFVDLKRAFETIDRAKLIGVLQKYGIHGTALKWFSSYLENRTQVTRYNSAVSPETTVDLGVPQGSVLGPLLFILYINDIKLALRRVQVNLFADDTVLFVVGKSFDECLDSMNEELVDFTEWLKWKKLQLNIAKTKCMVVTTKRTIDCRRCVLMDGGIVERVETMKYLGVMLDEKLNFNEHIDYTIRKAARKFGVLCRINRYLTAEAKVQVYNALIAPHFDYCSSILFLATQRQMKRMQVLQSKIMRLILKCDRLTPRRNMLDCLQWMSVKQRIEYNTLVFIFRVKERMAPQYLTEAMVYGRDIHEHNTRGADDLRLQNCKKACTQNSLFYKGFKLFNQLPEMAKTTSNINEFKRMCKEFVRQRSFE